MKIYRKRYIPDEEVLLKDDEVLFFNEDIIVTKWKVLKPRKDFAYGYSCYYLNLGYKISKFYNINDNLVYVYCDIISVDVKAGDEYIVHDLLADVIIYNDGAIKVLDIGEISEALELKIITVEQAITSLKNLDKLLSQLYEGKLEELTAPMDKYIGC